MILMNFDLPLVLSTRKCDPSKLCFRDYSSAEQVTRTVDFVQFYGHVRSCFHNRNQMDVRKRLEMLLLCTVNVECENSTC